MNKETSFDEMFDSIFKTIDVEHNEVTKPSSSETPRFNDKNSSFFNEIEQSNNKEGQ